MGCGGTDFFLDVCFFKVIVVQDYWACALEIHRAHKALG